MSAVEIPVWVWPFLAGALGAAAPTILQLRGWAKLGYPALRHPRLYLLGIVAFVVMGGAMAAFIITTDDPKSAFYIGLTFPTTVIAWGAKVPHGADGAAETGRDRPRRPRYPATP
jgi:hypothetical protein